MKGENQLSKVVLLTPQTLPPPPSLSHTHTYSLWLSLSDRVHSVAQVGLKLRALFLLQQSRARIMNMR